MTDKTVFNCLQRKSFRATWLRQ